MEFALAHRSIHHHFAVQGLELQPADHVGDLVQRAVVAGEAAAHFGAGVLALVAHAIHQQVHGLVGRHLAQVETQREQDAGGAVAAPEQHANPVLGRGREAALVQAELPVQRPALAPERRVEQLTLRLVAGVVEVLQVVAGDQFVVHHGAGEMAVVAAQRHQLLVVRHGVGGVGHPHVLAAQEERRLQLVLGREHGHAPVALGQFGHGHQVVVFQVGDGFIRQFDHQPGLLARRRVARLDDLQRLAPVGLAHFPRGSFHFALAPGQLAFGQFDQLLGRVGNQLVAQVGHQGVPADRVADDGFRVVGAGQRVAQQLGVRLHLLVQRLVGLPGPPAELRVVAGVEAVPLLEVAAHAVEQPRRAIGDDRRRAQRLRVFLQASLQRGQFTAAAVEGFGAGAGIGVVQRATRFGQGDQCVHARQQRGGLLVALALEIELVQAIGQVALQQRVVHLVFQRQRGDVHFGQARLPAGVQAAQGGFAADAGGDVVNALKRGQVGAEARHHRGHALRAGRHVFQRRHQRRRLRREGRRQRKRGAQGDRQQSARGRHGVTPGPGRAGGRCPG